MIFYIVYEMYYDISYPHKLCYRIRKVLHQFGRKAYGLVHHCVATQENEPCNFIDFIWLGDDWKYLFSISNFVLIFNHLCCHIKNHSSDAPSSPEYEFQGVSPHVFCLHNIGKLIHDQGIYNKSTKFFT